MERSHRDGNANCLEDPAWVGLVRRSCRRAAFNPQAVVTTASLDAAAGAGVFRQMWRAVDTWIGSMPGMAPAKPSV